MFSNIINMSPTPTFLDCILLLFYNQKVYISSFENESLTLKMIPNIITNSEKHPMLILQGATLQR